MGRVWTEFDAEPSGEPADPARETELRRATHKAIKAITDAVEGFRFNSAIARLHAFVGVVRQHPQAGAARREALVGAGAVLDRALRAAPGRRVLAAAGRDRPDRRATAWPTYDPALAEDEEQVLPVQINGKRRGEIRAGVGASEAEVQEAGA